MKDTVKVQFKYAKMSPIEGHDAIYAEYATTFGKYPSEAMSEVVQQTKMDLFVWWGPTEKRFEQAWLF